MIQTPYHPAQHHHFVVGARERKRVNQQRPISYIFLNTMGATSMVRGCVTRYLPAGDKVKTSSCADDTRFGDVEFEFLDDINGEMSSLAKSTASNNDECHPNDQMDLDEDDDHNGESSRDHNNGDAQENRIFWDNQHQLLQVINGPRSPLIIWLMILFLFLWFCFVH